MTRTLSLALLLAACLTGSAAEYQTIGTVERLDPALDALIPPGAQIEKLAEGYTWSEGPTWKDGTFLFSDVPENIVHQWKPGATKTEVFLKPSGLLHPTPGFREQGSNGLSVDAQNRLILCQHGERRVARLEADGKQTVLAERYDGKRFNSPNDLAIRRNGDLYFTDPPYGLEKLDASPLKELPFHGIYLVRASGGEPVLLSKEIQFPNGIAFSPDEKTLYIGVTAPKASRIAAFDVQPDGTLTNHRTFWDASALQAAGAKGSCDGLKVDAQGNLFCSAPGGLVILSPAGKTLGFLKTGDLISNCAWGDDGSTLYLTANHAVARIKTSTKGDRLTSH